MKRKLALFITLALAALLLLTACSGAKFDVHKVTFDADGGELSFFEGSASVQTYGTVDLPTPTKEGYVFEGWFIGEGVNEAQFTATSMVTSDITLKAKWTKAEYTVSFVDYYGNVISRETVKYGEAANAPAVPRVDEECLRFDAWDTDISAVKSDLTVKALYVIDSYTITYVTNNAQTIPPTSYFFDEIPVTPPSPGLSGHYFIGWYLDEEFTEEYLFDAPLTSDITVYACYNESIPIATLEDLLAIPEKSTDNYFLKNDIDCEGAVINSQIIGSTGTLDGCGHKIHNFVFQPTGTANTGLFATNGGTIKNITFDNFSYKLTITNLNSNVGFLTGSNSGTIDNVHITNASLSYTHIVSGGTSYETYYGGISGKNSGEVINCSIIGSTLYLEAFAECGKNATAKSILNGVSLVGRNSGNINNSNSDTAITSYINNSTSNDWYSYQESYLQLGGLVSINNGTISECDSILNAITSANTRSTRKAFIGGLVFINNSDIENCSANTTVTCNGTFSYTSAAGFVSINYGTVKNCYAIVDITNTNSYSRFGGFAGYNNGGIYKCYASGEMNVGAATEGKGGFAGYNNGSINSCFADVNITATDTTFYGPFVGNADTASYITNCYYNNKSTFITNGGPQLFKTTHAQATDTLNLTDEDFLIGTLGWSKDVWEFDPNKFNHPTLK